MHNLAALHKIAEVIKRYWKFIAIFSGALTSISAYILLAGPDIYMCEMEFVPPDFSVASPLLKNAALVPGSASDLERTYGYLHSFSLRQELIDSFNLYEHYGLQRISNPRRRAQRLEDILRDNIRISITKNATIAIRIYDASPDFSYKVALFLKNKVELFCREVIGMDKALSEKVRQLQELMQEIRTLEEKLSAIRVEYQIITFGEHRGSTVSIPTKAGFAQYDKLLSMESRLVKLQETYADLLEEKGRREDLVRIYSTPIFIIQPPYKPSYPVGHNPFIITAVALVSSLIVSTILITYAHHLGIIGHEPKKDIEPLIVSN
ncbi:MAG: hypothetical protein N2200_04665 [Bacteroidia bacterium]|nr:hypothetical protein [Bacteroidia bacterium]